MFCKHDDYTATDTSFVTALALECLRWLDSLVGALIVRSQCICSQQSKTNRISDLHLEATRQCLSSKSVHSSRCRFLAVLETIDNKLQQLPKVIVHESQRRNNRSQKGWLCVQFMLLGKSVRPAKKQSESEKMAVRPVYAPWKVGSRQTRGTSISPSFW